MDAPNQTMERAAEDLCETAIEAADKALNDPECSWADYATVLTAASTTVMNQRFGPQGGQYRYDYHQWATSRPLGFTGDGSQPVKGE